MSRKKITIYLSTAAVALALVAASSTAYAASIEVECEVRDDRSRAKVDAAGLEAFTEFSVTIESGSSMSTVNPVSDIDGELDADWDSNDEEATAEEPADESIDDDFIQGSNPMVTGTIRTTGGTFVVATTVTCEDRR